MESKVLINAKVAILIDGNNIGLELNKKFGDNRMMNYDPDKLDPVTNSNFMVRILRKRSLNRAVFFREGNSISDKLKKLFSTKLYGSVISCNKSADVRLTMEAISLINKVDTIIICSGDADYVPLVVHLKANGIRVEAACLAHSISPLLKEAVDDFHEITIEDTFEFIPQERKRFPISVPGPGNGSVIAVAADASGS